MLNLAMWRRREGLSSACKLCGERQTLLDVLKTTAIKHSPMCRYNEQHAAVLEVISNFMAKSLPEEYQHLADLPYQYLSFVMFFGEYSLYHIACAKCGHSSVPWY